MSIQSSESEYSLKILVLVAIFSLIAGILATHILEASHYHKQADNLRQNANVEYQNQESDISEYIAQIKGKLDCSRLKVPQNTEHCNFLNTVSP